MNIDSENIYQLLFENSSEGFLITNNKAQIEMVNKRTVELFGYDSSDELIGQKIEILIPKEYKKDHVAKRDSYIDAPVKRQMGKNQSLSGMRKDGSTFPVEVGLNSYEIQGEKKILALITDITERKEHEDAIFKLNAELEQKVEQRTEELKKSQHLYQLISRNFPNGTISVFDRDLNYVFIEGAELFRQGITSSQLLGKSFIERIPEKIRPIMKEKLESVFKGNIEQYIIEINNRHFEFNAVPLESEDSTEQILVVEREITKEKKAEADLEKALKDEKDLNELKSRFVSMASHEFRTPLSAISSSATLVSKYTENHQQEKRDKHVKRIKSSVSHMVDILNDFLSLSKLEEGIVEVNRENFEFATLLKEVIEEVKLSSEHLQVIKIDNLVKEFISTDKKILRQILTNLISNAFKYSFAESTIQCSAKVEKELLIFKITNEGMGIPDADQKNMFKRFFRAENASNIEGTGLGLNIVHKYVSILNGDIFFTSTLNETTTFLIQIPIK